MYYLGIFTAFLIYLEVTASCYGGATYPDYDPSYGSEAEPGAEASDNAEVGAGDNSSTEEDTGSASSENKHTTNIEAAWGGFEVPKENVEEWNKWLEAYKYDKQQEAEEKSTAYDKERGKGSGWPDEWQGIGGGSAGSPPEEPPPWAYVPVNVGLPTFCREPPRKGKCEDSITRWAYNPYTDTCVEFTYSGCGGNRNNFVTILKCEELCMTPAPSPNECDHNTHMEDYNLDTDRRRTPTRKCDNK